MGVMNCHQLCSEESIPAETNHDFLQVQHILDCPMCDCKVSHSHFEAHIDIKHFGAMRYWKQNIVVSCLLCLCDSNSLQSHAKHLSERHKASSNLTGDLTVSSMKNITLREQAEQFTGPIFIEPPYNDWEIKEGVQCRQEKGEWDGELYDVIERQKQYSGLEYDQKIAQAELVWTVIFDIYRKQRRRCKLYRFQWEPKQRSIVCRSLLLFQPL